MALTEPELNSLSWVRLMKSLTLDLGLTGTARYLGLLCTKGAGVGVYYS